LHANSVADVPARIEALCTAAGLSRDAAHSQLAAGLRVVIQLGRRSDGRRMLDAIGVLSRRTDGFVEAWSAVERRGSQWCDGVARGELDRVLGGPDQPAGAL
jgi:pilus assembly protein CpaF